VISRPFRRNAAANVDVVTAERGYGGEDDQWCCILNAE
jgi:hypothetical protein